MNKRILYFLPLLIITGCLPQLEGIGTFTELTAEEDSSGSTSGCTQNILDYGQKSSSTASARGAFSSTKMIPNTVLPAMAYSDVSSLTIKYTYWNGSRYVIENVAGDTGANSVKLAFKSNGVPMVFWSTAGTTVKMAIRSAASGTSGTWDAGIIDTFTGGATRALEVSVSPLDEVAVAYITHTATTPKARFLYCEADCSSPSGFQAMTASENIEGANVGTGQQQVGVAWCKVSATDYYPAVVYGGTAAARYAVCRQSSLSSCLAAASWTKVNLTGSAGNSAVNALHIDSSAIGGVPRAISKIAGGLAAFKMGTTACTAVPAALTTAVTLGGANTGSAWATLLQDSSSKLHVVANESTTSVRYYNSTTTDIAAAWNAVGTLDTVTLPAVGSGIGGATIDTTNNRVYTTYGLNAAPYNLVLGVVHDSTVSSASATFSTTIPDPTGNILISTTGLPLQAISTASTSGGLPAVAYVDFSAASATTAKLKYMYRTGASTTDTWIQTLPPGPVSPQFPTLAFDESNHPWIAYFEASNNRFYLLTNSSPDGTGYWSAFQFPDSPTGSYTLPATNDTALSMYYSGGVAYPLMMVLDATNTTSVGMKTALFNPSTGTWTNIKSNTPVVAFGANDGTKLTSAFDTSGNIVAAYYDLTTTKVSYVTTSDGGATWSTALSISGANQGAGATIRLNPVSGSPALSYYDLTNNKVYYAPCSGTPSGCASSGWTPSIIENAAGVSGLTTSTAQLLQVGVNFDTAGAVHLLYPLGQANSGGLMHATNASGSFIYTTRSAGSNGSIIGAPAVNFGVSGWGVVSTRTSLGEYFASYIGPGGWLYSSSCYY